MLSREGLDAEKSGGAVKGRVLRTPLGHESQKMHCAEQILAWTWDRQVQILSFLSVKSCQEVLVKVTKLRDY